VRTRFVAIVTVLAVLGAGCGGGGHAHKSSDPAPTSSGSTSVSPSPTPSGPLTTGPGVLPGEKPPVLSADAKQHTPAGALAFAAYFVKALDWSIATNDAYLLKQVAGPGCTACARDINAVAALHRRGAKESGRTTLLSSKLVTGTFKVKSDFVVEIVTHDDPIVITRPGAAPSTAAPEDNHDVSLVFISWVGNSWRIVEEGAPS
jgi:hypothetical protein